MNDRLERRRARLAPEQRALLDRMLRGEAPELDDASAPPEPTTDAPASLGQERLWFLQRLDPDATDYNEALALHLHGPLDVAALERALGALVRRHAVLRTTFEPGPDAVMQVVGERADVPLLRERVAAGTVAAASRRAAEALRVPFDLAGGPVLRARLLQIDDAEHVLLLCIHHIACDGWSLALLARELGFYYQAIHRGERSPLGEPPPAYVDFAREQRRHLAMPAVQAALTARVHKLAGAVPLALPTDRPRPTGARRPGATLVHDLPAALVEALHGLARAADTTLFAALLAGFVALLHRHGEQDDVIVGAPAAARTRAEFEATVGFFVNMLAIRIDLRGDPSFTGLLARAREAVLDAQSDQDLPFDRLVEAARPAREPGRHPLFDVMFGLHTVPDAPIELHDLRVAALEVTRETAKFDLSLYFTPAPSGLRGLFEYRSDLYDAATIAGVASQLSSLLVHAVRAPDLPISRLSLHAADRRVTATVAPSRRPNVHDQIARWAAHSPERLAVDGPRGQLRHGELDARAEAFASALRARGVGPDVLVGVLAERSPDAVVGVLAALKAGGAFVPLDPTHPPARIAALLAEARVPVLLAHRRLAASLPADVTDVLWLDDDPPPGPSAGRESAPDDLAYVIHTSGSTGAPRGVMVTHHNLAAAIDSQLAAYTIGPTSRVLQYASPAFDASVSELFTALVSGAVLHLAPPDPPLVGAELARLLQTAAITVATLTPSVLATVDPSPLPALRTLVIAGEVCPASLVAAWMPGRRLVNAYGPTEATIGATFWVADEATRPPPIGRPLAHATVHVLDRHGEPAAPGVPGELFIGGEGVARGYLHRPDLTAERFLPDPWSTVPGARLYRTGDRARVRSDGCLEFLGRLDDQIKLRGVRIEPGEVEAALRAHPAIRAARVVLREDHPGDPRLVAYCVTDSDAPTDDALRLHLALRLPRPLVPSAFVRLAALPRTTSGKLDVRALPAPSVASRSSAPSTPPRDELERTLATVWEDLLSVRPIGVDDDFFALGGHSLLAARLTAQLGRRLGAELPVAALFEHPTIARLAGALRRGSPARTASLVVALQPTGVATPFFCVHPIGGGVACYAGLARQLGAHRPFFGLVAPELVGASADGLDAIATIAARYVDEMRARRPAGPYMLGGWSLGGRIAHEMAAQLTAAGQQVALLALLDAHAAPEPAALGEAARLALLLHELAAQAGLQPPLWDTANADDATLRARAYAAARAAALVPPDVGPEFLERRLAALRRHERASARHVPRDYPGTLHVFAAADQRFAPHAGPSLGWSTRGREVVVDIVPGDHETILGAHVEALAVHLRTRLDAADRPPGGPR